MSEKSNRKNYQNRQDVFVKDPIIIRGVQNKAIFGLSSQFNEEFPSQLNGILAPEEFRDTLSQINKILSKQLENNFKWLIIGSIFCCCTFGCSILPVVVINNKARMSIKKLLYIENHRLYSRLGIEWKLSKVKCDSNALMEYVIIIDFAPTISLYQPV
ncbi:cysteine-rich hydrophobic domain-containing 2-like [Brachionus plicatilis]|uniref:Cysteine-rich hydrophobic domain-containing 2-like n=1 Tax=Brachionus plicatilis TaxID=10195 RepID=A0A3M7T3Z3_BRAPC|nr:cysteine-rich hydrophobic domain-containing 2-like [Brachionus plicatilis]